MNAKLAGGYFKSEKEKNTPKAQRKCQQSERPEDMTNNARHHKNCAYWREIKTSYKLTYFTTVAKGVIRELNSLGNSTRGKERTWRIQEFLKKT